MEKNTSLIYTGENFNIVFTDESILNQAFDIIKTIVLQSESAGCAEDIELDEENKKIFLTYGSIGCCDTVVKDICIKLAQTFPKSEFYGHAYYDDERCGYETCADYEFENGKLFVEMIESPNGPGCCPECGEQLVCFDEFDPNETYHCDDCEMDVSAEDMFDGEIPIKTVINLEF